MFSFRQVRTCPHPVILTRTQYAEGRRLKSRLMGRVFALVDNDCRRCPMQESRRRFDFSAVYALPLAVLPQ
jgi:hypothetical protein